MTQLQKKIIAIAQRQGQVTTADVAQINTAFLNAEKYASLTLGSMALRNGAA